MSAQKRLWVRFSKPNILGRNDCAETVLKTAQIQNMPDFAGTRSRCDCDRAPQGRSLHSPWSVGKQNRLFRNRQKIVRAFSVDQFIEFVSRERPAMFRK